MGKEKRDRPKRNIGVIKFEILKPLGGMTWKELSNILRDVRYRTQRLANKFMSERFLEAKLRQSNPGKEIPKTSIGELNRVLLEELIKEKKKKREEVKEFSRVGALCSTVYDALHQYNLYALTTKSAWTKVLRGESSLPTFKNNIPIPIRCDGDGRKRLARSWRGGVVLRLMVCLRPYPRVLLKTKRLSDGAKTVLERLLDNPDQLESGYRQRAFEVKYDEKKKKWWLYVTYDFPPEKVEVSKDIVVGVDLGYACPAYAALSNGEARLGWKVFAGIAARVKRIQIMTFATRRNMLRGGRSSLCEDTARSGHGRKRKLKCTEAQQGKINDAYTTMNHQISRAVVDFAERNHAGIIQVEDLSGLDDYLSGTFLGERWRYYQLQQYIEYKAEQCGIGFRKVNPRYTSRRCSKCGYINNGFTRKSRDSNKEKGGKTVKFECPECGHKSDPDYNAAKNLTVLGVDALIENQCKKQGIELSV